MNALLYENTDWNADWTTRNFWLRQRSFRVSLCFTPFASIICYSWLHLTGKISQFTHFWDATTHKVINSAPCVGHWSKERNAKFRITLVWISFTQCHSEKLIPDTINFRKVSTLADRYVAMALFSDLHRCSRLGCKKINFGRKKTRKQHKL